MNNKSDRSIIISVVHWIVANTSKEEAILCLLGMIRLQESG